MKSVSSEIEALSFVRTPTMVLVGMISLGHAIAFFWAARVLPWELWSTFTGASYVLAALHALAAVAAMVGAIGRGQAVFPSLVQRLTYGWLKFFRLSCWFSLAHATWFGTTLLAAGKYIADLYGGLGQGVAIALVVAMSGYFWLSLPFALWGLIKTASWRKTQQYRIVEKTAVVLGFLGIALIAGVMEPSKPHPVTKMREDLGIELKSQEIFSELQRSIVRRSPSSSPENWRPVVDNGPTSCSLAINKHRITIILAYRSQSICLQGRWNQVFAKLKQHWERIEVGEFAKIDVIVARQPMLSGIAWLDRLWIRPGQDGICIENKCLMPWQLVARGQFAASRPIPAIHDLRVGVDPLRLRTFFDSKSSRPKRSPPSWWPRSWIPLAWNEDPWAGVHRIETLSFVVDGSRRLNSHPVNPSQTELDQDSWRKSMTKAEAFIARAQHERGKFRYRLDPYTGKPDVASMSLARQAGTTLAWCELAGSTSVAERGAVAQKALRSLVDFEVDLGAAHRAALTSRPNRPSLRLGESALPLIALLQCRPLVGDQFDGVITRLGNFLLEMQRPDGGFFPTWNRKFNEAQDGPEPLYAVGQTIFALSMLEKRILEGALLVQIEGAKLRNAVERAMDFVAGPYWNHAGRPFFFIEENWNCLAARASLTHHRHLAYEQFCLDYVQFKSRLLLDETSQVRSEYWGAYGFGNVIPPHQTPAAGLAEALAASAAIKKAQGRSISAERTKIAKILQFLLRQQWNKETCYACFAPEVVDGGFSESMVSPTIRIDYVQHAWAALGHGGAILGFSRNNPPAVVGADV